MSLSRCKARLCEIAPVRAIFHHRAALPWSHYFLLSVGFDYWAIWLARWPAAAGRQAPGPGVTGHLHKSHGICPLITRKGLMIFVMKCGCGGNNISTLYFLNVTGRRGYRVGGESVPSNDLSSPPCLGHAASKQEHKGSFKHLALPKSCYSVANATPKKGQDGSLVSIPEYDKESLDKTQFSPNRRTADPKPVNPTSESGAEAIRSSPNQIKDMCHEVLNQDRKD